MGYYTHNGPVLAFAVETGKIKLNEKAFVSPLITPNPLQNSKQNVTHNKNTLTLNFSIGHFGKKKTFFSTFVTLTFYP